MQNKLYTKTINNTRNKTPVLNTSSEGVFQSQPKVVQTKAVAEKAQQKDLKASLRRAERYGHHPSQLDCSNQSSLAAGQPVQCATGFLGNFFNLMNGTRPKKPRNAGMTNQTHPSYQGGKGNLTTHHKYPFSQIAKDIQTHNIPNNLNSQAATNYLRWADPQSSKQQVDESQVAWVPHNTFIGPKGEDRTDDPGKFKNAPQVDTHFTASGTVTPHSEFALHAFKQGLPNFDPAELNNRLQSLVKTNKVSAYNPAEWTKDGTDKKGNSLFKQTGMPANWHKMTIDQRLDYADNQKTAKLTNFLQGL